jgi:hypothetical protein
MNHMTGSRDSFFELDTHICGTVTLGDGSIMKIEGHNTIVLMCKTGEHRALTEVYFIMRLKVSIISIRQLDESGCRVDIKAGIMCIYDQSNRLLAGVSVRTHRRGSLVMACSLWPSKLRLPETLGDS